MRSMLATSILAVISVLVIFIIGLLLVVEVQTRNCLDAPCPEIWAEYTCGEDNVSTILQNTTEEKWEFSCKDGSRYLIWSCGHGVDKAS
jgi:hypothetical protein